MSDVRAQAGGKVSVEDVLKAPKFPPEWPFSDADFKRMDESDDEVFCQLYGIVLLRKELSSCLQKINHALTNGLNVSTQVFYEQPRLVTHIDDKAIGALTQYYANEIAPQR